MNVGRKLMLIVVTSVVLVTIPATGIIYEFAKDNLLETETRNLIAETGAVTFTHTENLSHARLSLQSLSQLLAKRLTEPVRQNEVAEFDKLVQHDPDGAWRNRREIFDGKSEAGMFLPPDAPLDTQQKILHLRAKRVLDAFGGSVNTPFTNVWLLTHGKTEVIYDHGVPDFAQIMAADTDYTQTDWVTLGSPARNPDRGLRWTPPLFDPVPKSWMVSAIMPVDVEGHWIGMVGHDIYLNNVFPMLFQKSQRYSGEVHFLLDAQGHFMEAGPWQKQLESKPDDFKPDLSGETDLLHLLALRLTDQPKSYGHGVVFQGRQYLSIAMTIQPVGWRYIRLIPVDEILAPITSLIINLTLVVLTMGLLIGAAIEISAKRNIIARLQALADTVKRYGQGDLNARSDLSGDDEIAKTAREFNAMAGQMQATLNAIPDLFFEVGLDGRYYASHSPDEKLLAAPSHTLINNTVQETLPPDAAMIVMESLQEADRNGTSYGKQIELPLADGHRWFELSVARKSGDNQTTPRFIVLSRDITERKRAEAQLRIAATAFEAQEGIMITDADGLIVRVNKSFCEITGYQPEEVIGKNPNLLHSGYHDDQFYRRMWTSILKQGTWEGEIWNKRKNGDIYPEYLDITAVKLASGETTHYVGTFNDITERKIAQEKIEQLAFYDPLTALPNRRMLVDRLGQALASSARNGWNGALLFLDLDHFKSINDTLGHHKGDLLLQQVAQRLKDCVRMEDTVARLGGDEFVVMLEDLTQDTIASAEQTEAVAEKILQALSQPFMLDGYEYRNTTSIGATLFNGQQQSVEELLKQADIAMYQVKHAGRNSVRFFDPEMQETIVARAALEAELRIALETRQFELYYQIQVDSNQRPIGAEALVRWNHPERGLIPPMQFIPMLEETGMIVPLGLWVMETACAQLAAWQQAPLTQKLALAINVSAKQFSHPDFAEQVHDILQQHAINPSLLKLELTESMLVENIGKTIATMVRLKKYGIRFSLDDFGTGYSSLQYLKRLPLDQLKIDRSFVRDLDVNDNDRTIVRTIIAMAKNMGMDVIAEGVESEMQRRILMQYGCDHLQGYLFGKPVPIAQFMAELPPN